jgi:hypothetical protein
LARIIIIAIEEAAFSSVSSNFGSCGGPNNLLVEIRELENIAKEAHEPYAHFQNSYSNQFESHGRMKFEHCGGRRLYQFLLSEE